MSGFVVRLIAQRTNEQRLFQRPKVLPFVELNVFGRPIKRREMASMEKQGLLRIRERQHGMELTRHVRVLVFKDFDVDHESCAP